MMGNEITQIEVQFAPGDMESTRLTINRVEYGLYRVQASYERYASKGFPALERSERTGNVGIMEIDELARKIMLTSKQNWYHYYQDDLKVFDLIDAYRWYIRIEREDGNVERWEGVDEGPTSLKTAFEILQAFGMYGLMRHSYYDFEDLLPPVKKDDSDDCFEHILTFEQLFETGFVGEEDPGRQGLLLVDEFCDDVTLYLEHHMPEALSRQALETWKVDTTTTGLSLANVRRASRREMLVLFGALVQSKDSQAVVTELVSNGTLARWCKRLRQIPLDERKAQELERRQEEAARALIIDEAIRRRMEEKSIFTSYDLADECKVTAQQASVRIRTFVREGTLLPLEGGTPRHYRAAA